MIRCAISTIGQTVPAELAERQHLAGVVLPTLRTPSDRLSSPCRTAARSSCENGDGADGSSKHHQARALGFLHTEDIFCDARYFFSDAGLYVIENESFLHTFFKMCTRDIKVDGFH